MDALDDEILAVEAIYPGCILSHPSLPRHYTISLNSQNSPISVGLTFPNGYPDFCPLVDDCAGVSKESVKDLLVKDIWRRGEVCLYDLIDRLRELRPADDGNRNLQIDNHVHKASLQESSTSRPESPSNSDDNGTNHIQFFISEPIVDRKSTFVGRALEVHSVSEAKAALAWLLKTNKRVARATHNIRAWRIIENGRLIQDNDDDGEDAAGSRIAHLLDLMDVKNVMVIVTRWYGGIKLSSDRFRHINNACRDALQAGGFTPNKNEQATSGKERRAIRKK